MDSYKQPTKDLVRTEALTHAVELVTTRREQCAIVPSNYISRVVAELNSAERGSFDNDVAAMFEPSDIQSWETFRSSSIGTKGAADITVAYLAGPEPTNDLKQLIKLGVRPENIWAFESDKGVFASAHKDVESSSLRGVKLMNVGIEDYFLATPRRFDIIYFDACGTLPSHDQKTVQTLVSIFRHSALAPLGVLITNFSEPDISKDDTVCQNYTHLVASYLFPKSFLDTFDNPEHTTTDGAESSGFTLLASASQEEQVEEAEDGAEIEYPDRDFVEEVKNKFRNYYGSFITRQIVDIASIIAPMVRLMKSPLAKELVEKLDAAKKKGRRFVMFDPNCDDGDAISEPSFYSLLFTAASCGLLPVGADFAPVPSGVQKFCQRWANQLVGKPVEDLVAVDALCCFYALRDDEGLWAPALKRLAAFEYSKKMPFLCDVPTSEMAFYPTFAQISHPAHNNVAETRRYRYVAEGKQTAMHLDVLPFDECRYVYDWLSTSPLIAGDWLDISRQLVFRAALDAIAKNKRWYQDDFLYGCHVVGTNSDFDAPMYELRKDVSSPS